jgi:integrase
MAGIDQYIAAATRDNTRRSYRQAIEHYEVSWGGFLPATADSIARYLADHADTLALNTLRQRLAAIAQWHIDQGFPDPTKAPVVKKVLRGIAVMHPAVEKRARPLQLEQLEQLAHWLDSRITNATTAGDRAACLKHTRDKAIVLVGFWRAFRSDELSRLRVEHIDVIPREGMTVFLPHTKTDRKHSGTTFRTPALSRLCPVTAYQAWITVAQLTSGPVFLSIDRWGRLGSDGLRANSIIPLLKKLFHEAGVPEADSYSSHSLRRGFASWANANAWDVKALMEYVGWKDVQSALRYIDGADPFARQRIEAALPARQD